MDVGLSACQWSAHYETGNDNVDLQHQHIFLLVNAVIDETLGAGNSETLRADFDVLVDYVVNHFGDEEAFLRAAESQQLPTQVKEHGRLLNSLKAIWPNGDPRPVVLADLLKDWMDDELIVHILDSDMEAVQLARHSSVELETNESGRVERFEMIFDQNR